MEDDDDFGDLYTDVLSVTSIPTSANRKSPPAAVAAAGGGGGGTSSDEEEEKNIYGSSLPFASMQESVSIIRKRQVSAEDADTDWLLGREPASVDESESWVEDDEKVVVTRTSKDYVEGFFSEGGEPRVLVKDDVEAASRILEVEKDALDGEGFLEKTPKFLDHDDEPIIPGLANPPILNSGILKTSESDDWDSGSEDDLQIVLNDTGNDLRGVERRDGGGSDEDDEDLVIVTDDDQRLQHQAVEEQDWSNDAIQSSADGEKKDMLEAKATNAAPTVANAGIGYSSHGFHLQHHSMFKYVRPGATPAPRGSPMVAAGALGQVRPPAFGSLTGRGRGDWKPVAGSGFPNAQKGFHSGYGLAWGSIAASRPFGIGLDFSLPPHKTVFDIDIESFEEKPWRLPGVDLSDFFNFGLDEEHWKEYCKQLEQLRLESTMQGKIRVYESGRSEQDYDPDLPPELAAATGYNNMHADSINHGKSESRLADLSDQGSRNALMRPALPTGRAIQVESGFGERLPSIDTRPPRIRDSDAVIEIVLQDTVDDSKNWNSAFKRPESNFGRDNHNIFHDADEDDKPTNSEFYALFPHSSNIQQREFVARTVPTSANGNEAIPPFHSDSSRTYSSSPKAWSPVDAARLFETQRSGRSFQRTSHRKNSNASECVSEPLQNQNVHLDKSEESNMQDVNDEMEGNRASDSPPSVIARELTMEPKVAELDDKLALGDSHEGYGGKAYDIHVSTETVGDDGLINSANGQMLTSYIEQSGGRDNGAGDDDSRVTHSDNSQTRSGNSKDYQKTHEIGEVMMTHPLKPTGDLHKHREEADHRRRDGRRDAGRHRSRGRESMHEFYAQKSWDSGSGHTIRGKSVGFEREMNGTVGAWHRREDDIHYRQLKDEDIRRIHNEEIRPRERSKARMIERKEKSENHVKKQVDDRDDGLRDGDWRGQSRDVGVRHRERNDMLMNRRDTLEDGEVKRKRDAELARRDKSEKENSLHSYRAREDSRQKKRVRNDVDHRKREDDVRTKSKIEERQSSKHKDDNWHQRDREARQQVNFVHDDVLSLQGREERRSSASRGGRSMEKMLPGTGRSKEDFKVATSEKDYHDNDRRRHNDQSKRGNRSREENEQFNKARINSHSQDKRLNTEQKSTRHEKLGALTDRPSAATSDGHELQKEKLRENKKVKDTEFLELKVESNRRKHGGHTTHRTELSSKISSEQQSNRPTADDKKAYGNAEEMEASLLLSARHGNEDPVSDGESHESKRGRSKLERWTSHKERDYSIIDSNVQSSSIIKEFEASQNEGSELANADATKDKYDNTETNADEVLQGSDKLGEGDRHLDTVAKLKMRSERFKLPMPREKDKDLSGNKKAEGEAPSPCTQNETASADVDIKLERPARKRKWTGS